MVTLDLAGKVAVVTGAGRGIGEVIAMRMAEAGADMVLGDLLGEEIMRSAEQVKAQGGRAVALKTDVCSMSQVEALVELGITEYGKIDIMVNAAGILSALNILESTEESFDRQIDVNLKGVYCGCMAALKHMVPQRSGKIINISSIAGKKGSVLAPLYAATKFGVSGLSQSIALSVAKYGINVNYVCPGIIRTAMWESFMDKMEQDGSEQFTAGPDGDREALWEDIVRKKIPLGRAQKPVDVANTVLFLSSDLASEITGQGINVCGGIVMS